MGWSISVNIKSIKHRDLMLEFLVKNWRRWPEVNGEDNKDHTFSTDPLTGTEVCYGGGKKCNIGFEMHGFEPESDYIYQACRWMALTVGKKKKFIGINKSAPYINYDDEDHWPVLIRGEYKLEPACEFDWCFYDEYGTKEITERLVRIYSVFGLDVLKEFEKMRNEMIR